jgi:hypothetical protein
MSTLWTSNLFTRLTQLAVAPLKHLSNEPCSRSSIEAEQERMALMSLVGIGSIVRMAPKDSPIMLRCTEKTSDGGIALLFRDTHFWGLVVSKNASIRCAFFELLITVLSQFEPGEMDPYLGLMGKSIFCRGIHECSRNNISFMWEVVILLLHKFPNVIKQIDFHKIVYPQISSVIRARFYGSPDISSLRMLPIVSLLPAPRRDDQPYDVKADKRVDIVFQLAEQTVKAQGRGNKDTEFFVQATLETSHFLLVWSHSTLASGNGCFDAVVNAIFNHVLPLVRKASVQSMSVPGKFAWYEQGNSSVDARADWASAFVKLLLQTELYEQIEMCKLALESTFYACFDLQKKNNSDEIVVDNVDLFLAEILNQLSSQGLFSGKSSLLAKEGIRIAFLHSLDMVNNDEVLYQGGTNEAPAIIYHRTLLAATKRLKAIENSIPDLQILARQKFNCLFECFGNIESCNLESLVSLCRSYYTWAEHTELLEQDRAKLLTGALRNLSLGRWKENALEPFPHYQLVKAMIGMQELKTILPGLNFVLRSLSLNPSLSNESREDKIQFVAFVCKFYLSDVLGTISEIGQQILDLHRSILQDSLDLPVTRVSSSKIQNLFAALEFQEGIFRFCQDECEHKDDSLSRTCMKSLLHKTKFIDVLPTLFVIGSLPEVLPDGIINYAGHIWDAHGVDVGNLYCQFSDRSGKVHSDSYLGMFEFPSFLLDLRSVWQECGCKKRNFYLWADICASIIEMWNGTKCGFLRSLGLFDVVSWSEQNKSWSWQSTILSASELINNIGIAPLYTRCTEKDKHDFALLMANVSCGSLMSSLDRDSLNAVAKCFTHVLLPLLSRFSVSGLAPKDSEELAKDVLLALLDISFHSSFEKSIFVKSVLCNVAEEMALAFKGFEKSREITFEKATSAEETMPEAFDAAAERFVPEKVETKIAYERGDTVRYGPPGTKTNEIAVVVGVHPGEVGGDPFFTIRLSSGLEKQTEMSYLNPILSSTLFQEVAPKSANVDIPKNNSAHRNRRKKPKPAGSFLQASGIVPGWKTPGKLLEILTSMLRLIKGYYSLENLMLIMKVDGAVSRRSRISSVFGNLSLMFPLSRSLLPLLPEGERKQFAGSLRRQIQALCQEEPSDCPVKKMHFLVHAFQVCCLLGSYDKFDIAYLVESVEEFGRRMVQVTDIYMSSECTLASLDENDGIVNFGRHCLLCAFYAYTMPLVNARGDEATGIENKIFEVSTNLLKSPDEYFWKYSVDAISLDYIRVLLDRGVSFSCCRVAELSRIILSSYVQLNENLREFANSSVFKWEVAMKIWSCTSVILCDVEKFVQNQIHFAKVMVQDDDHASVDTTTMQLFRGVTSWYFPDTQVCCFFASSIFIKHEVDTETFMDMAFSVLEETGSIPRDLIKSAYLPPKQHLGLLLLWHLWLSRVRDDREGGKINTAVESDRRNFIFLSVVLNACCRGLNIFEKYTGYGGLYGPPGVLDGSVEDNIRSWGNLFYGSLGALKDEESTKTALLYTIYRTASILPLHTRRWWQDSLNRSQSSKFAEFMSSYVTPTLVKAEMSEFTDVSSSADDENELTIQCSAVSREIVATYVKDDCNIEMILSIPPTYPLDTVEVNCRKLVGIKQDKWRRWAVQIVALLSSRDGSLREGIMLWKHNVDETMDGVEPCPICYTVIQNTDRSMPNLSCRTCKNMFHSKCLYKWFSSSSSSSCPLCRSVF